MKVQIYEIQTPREADLMIALGVDHVGSVVLSEHAWKHGQLRSTIELVRTSGRKSCLIPLFGSVDIISQVIDYYRPDILHFCDTLPGGKDDPRLHDLLERQHIIRERFPDLELMRSIPIGKPGHGRILPSLDLATAFEPISDWFLTDTFLGDGAGPLDAQQPVNGFVGITGKTCDWSVARQLVKKSAIPVILAGGIGPHNIDAAIASVQPAGVDSCTLTNATDAQGAPIRFQKDPQKVRAVVDAARRSPQPH